MPDNKQMLDYKGNAYEPGCFLDNFHVKEVL